MTAIKGFDCRLFTAMSACGSGLCPGVTPEWIKTDMVEPLPLAARPANAVFYQVADDDTCAGCVDIAAAVHVLFSPSYYENNW